MKPPLSQSVSFASGPKKLPASSKEERDQAWNACLTQVEFNYYYDIAWQIAHLMLKFELMADIVANKVMDELWNREKPPSKAEIESHIRTLARSRSIDRFRTKGYQYWRKLTTLTQKNGEGEEYENLPEAHACVSAEETFYREVDNERFAQDLAQAILGLNDLQRICFVLCVIEKMKVGEVAKLLNLPSEEVSTKVIRARKRIASALRNERDVMTMNTKKGDLPSGDTAT